LREVLDAELGKVKAFLKKNKILENTLFFFIADHGQTRIIKHLDEKNLAETLSERFKVMDRPYSAKDADIVIMPGASTKVIYVRNGKNADWTSPPRLLEDVKPVVDVLIDIEDMKTSLNTLLVTQHPGERDEDTTISGTFSFFNLSFYRQSNRSDDDFINALKPLSGLDELVGKELKAAYMYRRDFHGNNTPDIILINKPGYYFAPDKGKYAHHGGIYHNDVYVSFVISGPGVHLFSDHPHRITHQIDTVDLLPMAAYLSDIKVDKRVDGKNWLLKVQ
jgi:arylsulfatase A-like enzyme